MTTKKLEQTTTTTTAAAKDATAQQQNVPDFTAEFDAKLKAMKAENKTWKEISEELGRSVSTVKTRFKQIKDDQNDAAADKSKSKAEPKSGDKTNAEPKPDDKMKADAKDKSKHNKTPTKPSKPTNNIAQARQPVILEEDDMFSYDELRTLVRIYQDDHAATWKRMASQFAHQTGRHVHARTLQIKFGQV
jgi:hypothetical protein